MVKGEAAPPREKPAPEIDPAPAFAGMPSMTARASGPLQSVLFPADLIRRRVDELARAITADLGACDDLLLLAVADGALVFAADLMRALPLRLRFATVKLSSYGGATASTGEVRLLGELPAVAGRTVLVVEDILDTGLTLNALHARLLAAGAAAVHTVVLLDKPAGRRQPFVPDYVGFRCPDAFVVGYGLDFDGLYRNLPDIGDLHPDLRPAG